MIDQEAEDLGSLKITTFFTIIKETGSYKPQKLPESPLELKRGQSAVTQCIADFVSEACGTVVQFACQSSLVDIVWHAFSEPETTPTGTGSNGVLYR